MTNEFFYMYIAGMVYPTLVGLIAMRKAEENRGLQFAVMLFMAFSWPVTAPLIAIALCLKPDKFLS